MRNGFRWIAGVAMSAGLLMGTAACDDFLIVENPDVVDATTVDPAADAGTFALSAQQNFAAAYGWLIMYSSWYTGEAEVSETFPTRNEFGRRNVNETNTSMSGDLWVPLTLASSSAETTLDILAGSPGEASNINVARAALYSGYAALLMSQDFCEGTVKQGVQPGPRLSQAQLRELAVQRFGRAIEVAGASTNAAAPGIRNAALVGRARTHLLGGQAQQALADAQQVPASFSFNMIYQDDPSNRTRMANRIWQFTLDRGSVSTAPGYRVEGDPRVQWNAPDGSFISQDAAVPFYRQLKYTAYSSPIRLASGIEAEYIAAEAQGPAAMLALIQREREANGLPAYDGPTDDQSVLIEFLEQRGREFWLEGQKMGDLQRHGNIVPHVPQPGEPYFKDGFAPIAGETCYPVPISEKDNNPNFQ